MDVTDIEAGVDFVDVLQRAVGSCDVLLAVIGREWLKCTDRDGRLRLDDPNDFIRLELGIALARDVRVVPVLVEGAVMPTASELPSDLEGLTRRQAVELRDGRWDADVESLANVLDRVMSSRTGGNPSPSKHPRPARTWGLAAVVLSVALAAVVTLMLRGGLMPSVPGSLNPAPATGQTARTLDFPAPQSARPTTPPLATAPVQPAPAPVSPGGGRPDAVSPDARPPATSGTVQVHYSADDDQKIAEDLAGELRKAIDDPRYDVRALKTSRSSGLEGKVLYSSSGLSTLAGTLARRAGSWLTRAYGRRVTFSLTVEPRVAVRGVIVNLPRKESTPAASKTDATVTIAYMTADDPRMVEELATFLRTRSSEYLVRTSRATASRGKEGQIEHGSDRMAGLAQVLAQTPVVGSRVPTAVRSYCGP